MSAILSKVSPSQSTPMIERPMEPEDMQRATMNILEDFDEEREKLQMLQRATMNLLEDVESEREKSDDMQRALLNILEDIEIERAKTEGAKSSLEAANKELESFSYSASHDLQAPLRAISGFSQAVLEDYAPKLDDHGKRYLRLIQENAQRMGQLIDDLLAFSRLGRQQMNEESIDMGALGTSVFDELVALEPDHNIQFLVLDVPSTKGDSNMIRQVLANLIANSIKFTRKKDMAIIELGYLSDLNEGAYFVRDNGAGFDMKYADKLFGVFQRLHSATEFEGTGVGLALIQRIITRHGGKVWAEGEPGQGATFYFTLPRG